MQTITSKNLRLNLKEVIDTVLNGEEYVLTFQSKPVGKIVPLDNPSANKKDLNALLASAEFKQDKIPNKLKDYKNFKDFHKNSYTKYD
jgi:antitoxin (DNA-binding transcriptional repressor) of toxin-antitoxin stability system